MRSRICSFLLTLLLFSACLEDNDPEIVKGSFTKIYDTDDFAATYYPIDVKQTSDGGYIVLSAFRMDASSFSGAYLLKVNENGDFVADLEIDPQYVNPAADLVSLGGQVYFLCMEALSLQAQLISVDESLTEHTIVPVGGAFYYPCAAAAYNGNLLALSYNHLTQQSVIGIISTEGTLTQSKGYTIGAGDDVEEPIINHFIRTGPQFPFRVGSSGSTFYFNGYYNYTFSLVFTDMSQDNPVGVVQGQQDDGGLSAVMPISQGTFAVARFNFGDNYFIPRAELSTSSVSSSTDLTGNSFPELDYNAWTRILRTTVNTQNLLVYASNTRSRQIGLYFYNEDDGSFLGNKYLGFSNPFELANLTTTEDGGLIVCGRTWLAGRFPRICLFKLSSKQLEDTIE